jgi:mRNA interferase MazF
VGVKRPGQIVVFNFPQTDLGVGKQRPALLLAPLPGNYDDWLICMISSNLNQYVEGLDEIINENSPDFVRSGLKTASVIRTTRLAVVSGEVLIGAVGEISPDRLMQVKNNLGDWIKSV